MCQACDTARATTILLVRDVVQGQRALLTALAIHARRPTSLTQHRLQRLKVAVALANQAIRDVVGPLPGSPEDEDEEN